MYLLMNKNACVAKIEKIEGPLGVSFELKETIGTMPLGYESFASIEQWIENRKASKHNGALKRLMEECGCAKTEGYINLTHAASINDAFWIKDESEKIGWKDVSFYTNEFNEVVSKLAFAGLGLQGEKFSGTVPEFSTGGSYQKCWVRESGEIVLYKRGFQGASNAGLEPYCEMLASEIASKVCKSYVKYDVANFMGEKASKCGLFTNEDVGFVPLAVIPEAYKSDNAMFEFYRKHGALDDFTRMILLDSLIFNPDRHLNNHGVLVDNETQKIIGMCPVFDLNLALFPYADNEEFAHIGDKLLELSPQIGEDFTTIGQKMLEINPTLKKTLINLKGFRFSFRGDKTFKPERVRALEKIVDKQIEAILDTQPLQTKCVFPPSPKGPTPEELLDMAANQILDADLADSAELLFRDGKPALEVKNFGIQNCAMVFDRNGNFIQATLNGKPLSLEQGNSGKEFSLDEYIRFVQKKSQIQDVILRQGKERQTEEKVKNFDRTER